MADSIKSRQTLAALIFLFCISMFAPGCGYSMNRTSIFSDDIIELANFLAKNKVNYGDFVGNKSEIKNVKTDYADGSHDKSFKFNSLERCVPRDNSYDIGDDDKKTRPLSEFRCMNVNVIPTLSDISSKFGRLYILYRSLDNDSSTEKSSDKFRRYEIATEKSPVDDVSFRFIVKTKLDLINEINKNGEYPVIYDEIIANHGAEIQIDGVNIEHIDQKRI